MEFCGICDATLDFDDERPIRCSGQRCNLIFHQRCSQLTEAHVRSWLEEDVGLFWFCQACRVDFAPDGARSSRKRKVCENQQSEEQEGESSVRQLKKVRLDPETRLPPEIWAMVLQHLESSWLGRVRLVCRDLNELVCSRTELMDRFLLKLGKAQLVDDLDEVRHFLALSEGFTRAHLDFSEVGKEKPRIDWFLSLGQTLTNLTCWSMTFGFLFDLLRTLPNLKQLTVANCFEYGKVVKLNYQLAKLEKLTIRQFNNKKYGNSIFPSLQHICPRIKDLEFGDGACDQFPNEIASFISAVRETLQGLSISVRSRMMNELVKVVDLRLKRISIDCSEHYLLQVLRWQPSLEHLHFRSQLTNVAIFEAIPRILPNLITLELDKVDMAPTAPPNPLNLTRAEFIRVRYETTPECVSGLSFCLSPSLQRLEISGAYLPSDALANLGQTATRIKNVTFSSCRIQRASDILTFCQQSKSLTVLELHWLTVASVGDMPDPSNGHSNLRHLTVNEKSSELLPALVELCPDLESLKTMNRISEKDMDLMGQQLKHLKLLKLCWHETARKCLRKIQNGFEALKNLQIACCRVSKEDIREELQGLRKNVEVAVEFWRPGQVIAPPPPRKFQII